MKTLTTKEFNQRWQRAKTTPAQLSLKSRTPKPQITLTSILDRYKQRMAKATAEHLIEPQLQAEVEAAIDELKRVLRKVPEKKLG